MRNAVGRNQSVPQLFLLTRKRHCAARKGESKGGGRLGSFFFAISLRNDKEMASIVAQRTREAVCARRRSSRKFNFPPLAASPNP